MTNQKSFEILHSIAETCFNLPLSSDALLADQVHAAGWNQRLSDVLHEQLQVNLTPREVESAGSLSKLSELVESRLDRDSKGRSLVDIYAAVEEFVREELSHEINYHWHASWLGDLLNDTDSLEDVEIVIRMEEAFGFSIPDREAQQMHTVGQTVRYLWQRLIKQSFTLRQRPKEVCQSAFTFHELRRLLMIRGQVPRATVRLDARLGDLLPNWYFQFWKQIPSIFGRNLPHRSPLSRILGLEKRTTLRELIALLADSN
jgi:acyl carrier protein